MRSESGIIKQKLVKIDRAILRVSNLAIHLQSDEERKGFSPNKEDHLSPILATAATKTLSQTVASEMVDGGKEGKQDVEQTEKDGWTEFQEPLLISLLANELQVDASDIVDFELSLFDTQKAALGGAHSGKQFLLIRMDKFQTNVSCNRLEFIHSARLDNLASCFLAVEALVECMDEELLSGDKDINMVVLYDHEEVGSGSAYVKQCLVLPEHRH